MDLSDDLSDLLRQLHEWTSPDLAERLEKLANAPDDVLHELIRLTLPHIAAIDAYLDSHGEGPFDEPALRLMRLAESAVEARRELLDRDAP